MHARVLFLGLAWMALALGQAQEVPSPAPQAAASQEQLDGGLLEPAWFGPGPVWSRDWRVDYFWAKPGVRMDPPAIYLSPWEEPKFLSERGSLDYASGWQAAELLQYRLRTRLKGIPGIRLATSPEQTPYHALGRIVEATHIRQGAVATFGLAAGLPTFTWDFKVVDVRTGEVLLASHHRSIWGPASTWITALEPSLRTMVGLPPFPKWEVPPDSQQQEDGSWTWEAPGLRLRPGCLEAGSWTAETDTGGWWKMWTNGPMASSMAAGIQVFLQERVARSGLARRPEEESAYLLTGQIFSTPKYLKVRYRAVVTEVATGRIVARHEIRSPIGLPNGVWTEVSERLVSHLETLQEAAANFPGSGAEPPSTEMNHPPEQGPSGASGPQAVSPVADKGEASPQPVSPGTHKGVAGPPLSSPTVDQGSAFPQPAGPVAEGVVANPQPASTFADKGPAVPAVQAPAPPWEGLDRLAPASGAVDKAWVSPTLSLAGRTLLVADWGEPVLKPEADAYDQRVAKGISVLAPAWLYGALASHPDRGFRIHRQEGDVRLEGRVVHLYQPDRSKFWTMMGQAYTLGLSTKAEGILQIRVVDIPTGRTLALVEENLGSFQMASSGIPYKAFKWLAQDLVPWLLKEGLRPQQPKATTPEAP